MTITEGMREQLVEQLCADGWSTTQAWAAAQDSDNWQEMTDGSIEPNVIATSDQYDGQQVDMGNRFAIVRP